MTRRTQPGRNGERRGPKADTVCALATPPGTGAIAVIRVSGPEALAIADRVFRGKRSLARSPGYSILHGHLQVPANGNGRQAARPEAGPVDEVLVSVFRAPHSYTGEDMVEISSHGGVAAPDAVMQLLAECGARPAAPGEFTRRAVLNGKLDLIQAEAVLDIIQASDRAARERAVRQLTGVFSHRIEDLRSELASLQARLTVLLEFGEELPSGASRAVDRQLRRASQQLSGLLEQAESGPRLRRGALVAIVGRPNVGKSSLFNRLVGEERAIVTPIPGTTRDAIEASVELDGHVLRLVDTAGWRARAGHIEALGAARARHCADRADALLLVLDASRPLTDDDRQLAAATAAKRRILVLNKTDLPACRAEPPDGFAGDQAPRIRVSARTGQGIARLRRTISRVSGREDGRSDFTANRRHIENLRQARQAIRAAAASSALDVRIAETGAAAGALDELLGRRSSEQVLDQVFREFCVGK